MTVGLWSLFPEPRARQNTLLRARRNRHLTIRIATKTPGPRRRERRNWIANTTPRLDPRKFQDPIVTAKGERRAQIAPHTVLNPSDVPTKILWCPTDLALRQVFWTWYWSD